MADNQREGDKNRQRATDDTNLEQQTGSGRSYDYGAEGSEGQSSETGQQNTSSQQGDATTQTNRSNSNSDHQNASANRGGTTDMGSEILTGPGQTGRKSASQTTKRNVTGSDYDGQVSE